MKAKKWLSVLLSLLLIVSTVVLVPSKAAAEVYSEGKKVSDASKLEAALDNAAIDKIMLFPKGIRCIEFPVLNHPIDIARDVAIETRNTIVDAKTDAFVIGSEDGRPVNVAFETRHGDGVVTAGKSGVGSAIVVKKGATVKLFAATYASEHGAAIIVENGGKVIIDGATIKGSIDTGLAIQEGGSVDIKSGTFVGFNPQGMAGVSFGEGEIIDLGDGSYSFGPEKVAAIGEKTYHTLPDAIQHVSEGETITLIADGDVVEGKGLKHGAVDAFTIDFAGKTYDVVGGLVGFKKKESRAIQFLAGSDITLKNGTVRSRVSKGLVGSYGTLTLDHLTLDGSGQYGSPKYTLCAVNGVILLKNGSKCLGHEDANIVLKCWKPLSPDGITVVIDDTCPSDGFVNSSTVVESGKINDYNEQEKFEKVVFIAPAAWCQDSPLCQDTTSNYNWIEYKPGYMRLAKNTTTLTAYTGLEANGAAGKTDTDVLTVAFASPVPDLQADDFIIDGATIESAVTADQGQTYMIRIKDVTKENGETLSVGVAKEGIHFAPLEREAVIYKFVNKDDLRQSIREAGEAKETVEYKNASADKKQAFEEALAKANDTNGDDAVTQREVDAAKATLDETRAALDGKQPDTTEPSSAGSSESTPTPDTSGSTSGTSGSSKRPTPAHYGASKTDTVSASNTANADTAKANKVDLQAAFDTLDRDLNNGTEYTDETVKDVEEAIREAKKVLDDKNATQEDIDKALQNVENAKNNMRLNVALETVKRPAFMFGYPDGTFSGNRSMTRAEVAAMFSRIMLDKPVEGVVYPCDFSDVFADDWYANVIGFMSGKGLLSGYPDGTFRPDDPITRAEFAALATRFAKIGDVDGKAFNDVDGHWAEDVIEKASAVGWVGGYEDATFKPDGNITRAEATAIANRMMYRTADRPFVDGHEQDVNQFVDLHDEYWAYNDIMEAINGHDYDVDHDALEESWEALNGKHFEAIQTHPKHDALGEFF